MTDDSGDRQERLASLAKTFSGILGAEVSPEQVEGMVAMVHMLESGGRLQFDEINSGSYSSMSTVLAAPVHSNSWPPHISNRFHMPGMTGNATPGMGRHPGGFVKSYVTVPITKKLK